MGKSDAKKRLRKIEREVNKYREQQRNFDKLINDLEQKRQKVLEQLGSNGIILNDSENQQTFDLHQMRRACLRTKQSLEKIKESAEKVLILLDDNEDNGSDNHDIDPVVLPMSRDNHINGINVLEQSPVQAEEEKPDLLEAINNPAVLKAAQDLMTDLFKED